MKKILIVDDSSVVRTILRRELEAQKEYEVYEADSGGAALDLIEDLNPDLITLDIEMPGLDGFQTCAAIRALRAPYANIPVIFVTAKDTVDGRSHGYRVGGNDFIIKPFVKSELLNAVEQQFNKRDEILGSRILVVDDSPLVRQILENYLSKEGIKVISTNRGDTALAFLKKLINRIDAIITDYHMPGIDGEELCRAIREDIGDKDIPILFITGNRKVVDKLFHAGASDYLHKPFSKDELLARIRVHINSMRTKRLLYKNLIEVKRLTRYLEQYNTELELAKQSIEKKNRQIEDDLQVAGGLQQEFLIGSEIPDYLDVSSAYFPHTYVSGDIFFIRENEAGACNIFLGDTAGHGVAPAFATIMANTLLGKHNEDESLESILLHLNYDIEKFLPHDRYMTAVLIRIFEDGKTILSNAGHPSIVIIPANDDELKTIKPNGIPLGMFENDMVEYEEEEYQLSPGDKLVLFSDGIIEQKNKEGEEYSLERFYKKLKENRDYSVSEMLTNVLKDFDEYVGSTPKDDDITVLAIRYK